MQIAPKILKGFRDFFPDQEMRRRETFAILERTFRSHGFVPIDTPALEYREVLLGKGGGETDKQVYAFRDNGKRDVALRFDLTVPFARYMAMHANQLSLPFKRYHIAKVWRGENTQRGRYREFFQCDFDIVGLDSVEADFEILLIIINSLRALGLQQFTIRISHRGLFNTYLQQLGIADNSVDILRIVDKLGKVGREATVAMLQEVVGEGAAKQIVSFISAGRAADGSFLHHSAVLQKLATFVGPCEHLSRLENLFRYLEATGTEQLFVLDPSITRGLDYYTGIVYETFLDPLPGIGSICSGGRYNNLASLYTKEHLPGVGASIGIDRLLAALEEPELLQQLGETLYPQADALILCLDSALFAYYQQIATQLRAAGIKTEVFLSPKKLGQQFKYAEKGRIPFAVIAGEAERAAGQVNLKNLQTFTEQRGVSIDEAVALIQSSTS